MTSCVVIAHRGASGHAPEHTFAAYDLALAMGADFLEQDLQRTADGVLVVLHDETLDRTCRGLGGPVAVRTLAELKRCDAGRWFNERHPDRARPEFVGLTVPTLEEVFGRYGARANYYIETKSPESAPGMEEALVRLIAANGLRGAEPARLRTGGHEPVGAVVIQSFSAASLRRVRTLEPSLPCVQLVDAGRSSEAVSASLETVAEYAAGIGPEKGSIDAALVDAAHRLGLVVHPYTVNEPEELTALIELGVDGLFTNFPDRLTRH